MASGEHPNASTDSGMASGKNITSVAACTSYKIIIRILLLFAFTNFAFNKYKKKWKKN
jgi:hypothetical protein